MKKLVLQLTILFFIGIAFFQGGCEEELSPIDILPDTVYLALKVDYDKKINLDVISDATSRMQRMKVYVYTGSRLIKDMYWHTDLYEIDNGRIQYFDIFYFKALENESVRVVFEPENEWMFNTNSREYLPLYLVDNEFMYNITSDSLLTVNLEFVNQGWSKIRVLQTRDKWSAQVLIDGEWGSLYEDYSYISTFTNGDTALVYTYEFGNVSYHIDELTIPLQPDVCYTVQTDDNLTILAVEEDPITLW